MITPSRFAQMLCRSGWDTTCLRAACDWLMGHIFCITSRPLLFSCSVIWWHEAKIFPPIWNRISNGLSPNLGVPFQTFAGFTISSMPFERFKTLLAPSAIFRISHLDHMFLRLDHTTRLDPTVNPSLVELRHDLIKHYGASFQSGFFFREQVNDEMASLFLYSLNSIYIFISICTLGSRFLPCRCNGNLCWSSKHSTQRLSCVFSTQSGSSQKMMMWGAAGWLSGWHIRLLISGSWVQTPHGG